MKHIIFYYLLISSCCLFAQVPIETFGFGEVKVYQYDKTGNAPSRIKDRAIFIINAKGEEELVFAINDSSIINDGVVYPKSWPGKNYFVTDTICGFVVSTMELFYRIKNIYIFKKNNSGVWELSNSYLKVIMELDMSSIVQSISFLSQNIISITCCGVRGRTTQLIILKNDNTIERYTREEPPITSPLTPTNKH